MFKSLCAAACLASTVSVAHAADYANVTNDAFGRQFAITVEQSGEFAGALIMQGINGSDAQLMAVEELGDGSVQFTTRLSGPDVCMTIVNEEQMPNGIVAVMADCEEDDPAQRFYVSQSGPGMQITNQSFGNGQCLSASDNSEFMPYLTLEGCRGAPDQQWIASPQ